MSPLILIRLVIACATVLCCLFSISGAASEIENAALPETIDQLEITENRVAFSSRITGLEVAREVIDGVEYDLFAAEDAPCIAEEGFPMLPFISKSILIPYHSEVELTIEDVEFRIDESLQPLFADAQRAHSDLRSGGVPAAMDVSPDGFFPAQPVMAGETAILRGYRILNYRIYPVQYNHETGTARIIESVNYHFAIEGGKVQLNNIQSERPSMFAWNAVRNLVINPPDEPARDDLLSASYLYIIPQYNGIRETIEPLLDWRIRQGHNVRVEYVDNGAGRGEITGIIEDAYEGENPVEFVTLVGDVSRADFTLDASDNFGDYGYTLIEGNDPLPDVAIGRLSCNNLNQLETIVDKILTYETDPPMDDTDWFLQGAVVAGHRGNGLGTVLVAKYVRRELYKLGFQEIRSWLHTEDGEIPGRRQPFVNEVFEWGISILHYRAYQYMNRLDVNEIYNLPNNRSQKWPAVLAISCDTGDFTNADGHTEAFLRSDGGGVGAIGTATPRTAPQYNNMMAGGVWKGIYKTGLHSFGWGLNAGKYELWRAYHGFDNRYSGFMQWNNLMGDAGTHIWTGIPRLTDVEFEESIPVGGSYFSVHVADRESGEDEADALVCIYKEEQIHLTKYTNENGTAEFAIDPEALSEGDLLVTVTKHNVLPFQGEAEIEPFDSHLGVAGFTIDDDREGESDGNDNNAINPGERVEIGFDIGNFGEEAPDDAPFEITIVSDSPWIEIISEDLQLEEAPEPGDAEIVDFILNVDPACPDLRNLNIQVDISGEQLSWRSMIPLEVEAARIIAETVHIEGGDLDRGEIRDVDITLANAGRFAISAFNATLTAENDAVLIRRDEADYNAIDAGENSRAAGDPFQLQASPAAIPGMQVEMTLAVESEDGFRDTTTFSVTLGEPGNGDPFGPDEYGYVCFDSGDEEWEMAPDYDWIEIDPGEDNNQFDGTELNLNDPNDNQDESVALPLPFDFQYYGETFDTITVCTNGWAAFGDQAELAAFRNRHIGQALGPDAQLCVWWDNLRTANESKILVHHDDEEGRFIIEWNKMERLVQGGRGATETFEIILFDPEFRPTYTGDGIITFQYKEIENQGTQARNDTPYCTIGISNLDDSGGLEYTYWNQYTPGAKQIENEMAITFTTATSFITGVFRGSVWDASSRFPVRGAEVMTSKGFSAITDDAGRYSIEALIGDNYHLTARAEGYNDSTLGAFEVEEDDTITVNFGLLFSRFELSTDRIEEGLPENESRDVPFTISNNGNGPLEWSAERTFAEGESGFGRRIRKLVVGPEVNDLGMEGVVYANGEFYASGQNGQNPNMIYVFDNDGARLRSFQQVGEAREGMFDLTYGRDLLWGSGEQEVYGFTTDGALIQSFRGPYATNRSIAYDPDRDVLWIHSHNRSIIAVDFEGEWITALDSYWPRITGMTYWAEDPDGCCLYICENPGQHFCAVHKYNPTTEDTAFVALLETEEIGQAGGIHIATDYDRFGNVFMVMINDYLNEIGDRIDVWQLGTYTGWMDLNLYEGAVEPMSETELNLTLNARGLFPSTYEGSINFDHTGRGDRSVIDVILDVIDLAATESYELPLKFGIESVYPNPFNSTAVLKYSLPVAANTRIDIYSVNGRTVETIAPGKLDPGRHSTRIDAQEWAAGVYIVKLRSGMKTATKKILNFK